MSEIIHAEDVKGVIGQFLSHNDGNEAATDLILNIGAELLGVSADTMKEIIESLPAPKPPSKKVFVTMAVDGKFVAGVDANVRPDGSVDLDDARVKATRAYSDADFGELSDIEMSFRFMEDENGGWLTPPDD